MCSKCYQGTGVGPLLLLILALLAGCGGAASAVRAAPTLASPTTEAAVNRAGVPACHANQLAGQFRAGGYATGNITGELLIHNVSPAACTVHGQVSFSGIDAQGERIAATKMNQPQILAPAVLPPNTPAAAPGVEPTAGAYLVLLLIGIYRDDPTAANALCSAANEVTPSQFVIGVGAVSVQVANLDPAGLDFKALYGCHGFILGEGASVSF
jgi:hypothetical protein